MELHYHDNYEDFTKKTILELAKELKRVIGERNYENSQKLEYCQKIGEMGLIVDGYRKLNKELEEKIKHLETKQL